MKLTCGSHNFYAQSIQDFCLFSSSRELFRSMVQHNVCCFGQNKLIKWFLSQNKNNKNNSLYLDRIFIFHRMCVLWHMCKPPVHRDPFTSVKVRTTLSSKSIKTYIIMLARFPTNHFNKAASSNRTNVIPLKKQICWIRFKCSFLLPSFHI